MKIRNRHRNSRHRCQRFTVTFLEQKDKEMVKVEDEIEFAKIYCNLLKTRFEDSDLF
jgi:LytS/YehU family sensor histidine kinase